MIKHIGKNIFWLFIAPRRYFKTLIRNKYNFKDLFITGVILIPVISIFYSLHLNRTNQYSDLLSKYIHILGFALGMALSFAFRTYFLTLLLKKNQAEQRYQDVGIIIAISLVVYVLMYPSLFIPGASNHSEIIHFLFRLWNLILIFIGIQVISNINFYKAFILISAMLLIETFVQWAILGIKI